MRRAGVAALVVLIAAAGAFGLVRFFQGRDKATFGSVEGPGQLEPDRGRSHEAGQGSGVSVPPPTSGAHAVVPIPRDDVALNDDQVLSALEPGSVVLVYGDRGLRAPLKALARDVAGAFDPDLAAAGQAVVLDRLPAASAGSGVTALAWRHRLKVASPQDAALRDFIEFWLGRGAG